MKKILNDARSFCALCTGAAFAFGFSACMAVGLPVNGLGKDLFTASIVSLVCAALMFISIKITEKRGVDDDVE